MTKISAKVIADSKNESCNFSPRITTMVVVFPRHILAELNTHRMMSRNSASSRAIPFAKMVDSIKKDPFVPIAFGKNHTGMQGTEYHEGQDYIIRKNKWLDTRWKVMVDAIDMADLDVTKQIVNRMLEAYMWHTVIITASEWENFFALRCPSYVIGNKTFRSRKDLLEYLSDDPSSHALYSAKSTVEWLKVNTGQAEIHMMELAEQMWDAMNESTPKQLKAGDWHIPFGDDIDLELSKIASDTRREELGNQKVKIATAMCARVSYTVVGEEGKEPNYENDIKLHDRLISSGHMSPTEHCARAMSDEEYRQHVNGVVMEDGDSQDEIIFGWSGNFRGFIQYRKTLIGENITVNA